MIKIADLMQQSGVTFGTSGARGLADAMTDRICYLYTLAFIRHLENQQQIMRGTRIAIAGDFRTSTPRIMAAVSRAISDAGYHTENCGLIPTPAVVLYGIEQRIPAIMVTGSHIPEDRNGIKFNKPDGEILKEDEAAIKAITLTTEEVQFDQQGRYKQSAPLAEVNKTAEQLYRARYSDFFGNTILKGKQIGVYQHSSVARQLMVDILEDLGATVTPLGYSETFIAVDTEAVRSEDVELAREWSKLHHFDAIVTTDGDGDRPMITNEKGEWLRGDIVGILTAQQLQATAVATPVNSNSALEKSNLFQIIKRTRIGSPYVIEAMNQLQQVSSEFSVVGYEANGGFLIQNPIEQREIKLSPLPTRDAMIVLVAILVQSNEQNKSILELTRELPQRFTTSDRLKQIAIERSQALIRKLTDGDEEDNRNAIHTLLGEISGNVVQIDQTDGLRMTFKNQEIIHLRPSGNAPELRCYSEADTKARAEDIMRRTLTLIEHSLIN